MTSEGCRDNFPAPLTTSGRWLPRNHPDWMLGTNLRASHGCIRLTRAMSRTLWDFTSGPATRVRVV